jgi:hypothetical protein
MRHRMGPPFSPWIHVGPPIDLKTEQGYRWNDAVPEAGARAPRFVGMRWRQQTLLPATQTQH